MVGRGDKRKAAPNGLVHDSVSRPMDRKSRYQRDKPRQSDCSKNTRSRPADSRTYEPWAHFRRAVLAIRIFASTIDDYGC